MICSDFRASLFWAGTVAIDTVASPARRDISFRHPPDTYKGIFHGRRVVNDTSKRFVQVIPALCGGVSAAGGEGWAVNNTGWVDQATCSLLHRSPIATHWSLITTLYAN